MSFLSALGLGLNRDSSCITRVPDGISFLFPVESLNAEGKFLLMHFCDSSYTFIFCTSEFHF